MKTDSQTLTQEEQVFAEQNHGILLAYLRKCRLCRDDWYDVLVFGYLKAVRCWFRTQEVRKWPFSTIASVKMRAAIIGQYRYENRAMRKGSAISMDAPCGEDETATLHGLIASGEDGVEQAMFEMLVESMASCLGSTERAVLQLITEGYTPFEVGRELALPRKAVDQALAVIRDCYVEREAVY